MKRKARNLGLGGMAILTGAVPVSAYAACSATAPGSGTTVTCTGANAPSVVATAGSTGVTINLDSTEPLGFLGQCRALVFGLS